VTTSSEYKIKFSLKEARQLKFWNYYFNPSCPNVIRMGSGLHRYLTDEQATQILRDIINIKKGTDDEILSIQFCNQFCKINGINIELLPAPCGGLRR